MPIRPLTQLRRLLPGGFDLGRDQCLHAGWNHVALGHGAPFVRRHGLNDTIDNVVEAEPMLVGMMCLNQDADLGDQRRGICGTKLGLHLGIGMRAAAPFTGKAQEIVSPCKSAIFKARRVRGAHGTAPPRARVPAGNAVRFRYRPTPQVFKIFVI
jgi:hypothetical protein